MSCRIIIYLNAIGVQVDEIISVDVESEDWSLVGRRCSLFTIGNNRKRRSVVSGNCPVYLPSDQILSYLINHNLTGSDLRKVN